MARSPQRERAYRSSEAAKEGELIRIVIADDHPIFRDGLRKLLTLEEDFRVVAEARDGKEVLEVLDEHQPDILLLDLKMPGLDGLTTLQKLQNSRTKTKVIVLTASDDKNEFVQAMKFGTCGIVLKQTATELLIKSIRKVHAGEIWLDSHTTAAVMRQFSSPMESRRRSAAATAIATVLRSASASGRSWSWWRRDSRIRRWPRRCSSASRR